MLLSEFVWFDRKAHSRKTKKGKRINVKQSRIKKTQDNKNVQLAAGALGLSAGGFLVLRGRYRANLSQHLTKVRTMASQINPDTIINPNLVKPDSKLTMVLPGLSGKNFSKAQDKYIENLKTVLNDSKRVYIKSSMDYFNTPSVSTGNKVLDDVVHYASAPGVVTKALFRGENPDAIKAAAEVMALRNKYGKNMHIDMIGHSGGGITFRESNYLLSKLGDTTTRSISTGSPNMGILPTIKRHISINSDLDPVTFTTVDKTNLKSFSDGGRDHISESFFKSKQFRNILKTTLAGGTAGGGYTAYNNEKR